MPITGIQPNIYSLQQLRRPDTRQSAESRGPGIGEQLAKALENVNALQQNANTLAEQVGSGNVEDSHKAMIAMERALLGLDLTLQVRNKMLEAYQEIMRTQI